jgi:hypothetical protein
MTVQHVHVAEGGQAIVGNVSASAEGVGARKKSEDHGGLGFWRSSQSHRRAGVLVPWLPAGCSQNAPLRRQVALGA